MSQHRKNIVLGVALIAIGVLFLLDRANIFDFSWPLILVAIGAALLSGVIAEKKTDTVFPGVLLLLLGVAFFLIESRSFYLGYADGWPLIMLAVGIAFIVAYFTNTEKGAGPLIPGGIISLVAVLFLLANYRVIHWHGVWGIIRWWPVILIVVGIYLLLRKNK